MNKMDKEQTKKKLLDSIKYVEFDDQGRVVKMSGVGTAKDFKKKIIVVKDSEYSVAPKDLCEVLEIKRMC